MRIAIVTDNDCANVNGVTTTLKAVLEHAPADVRPRVYAFSGESVDDAGYCALKATAVPIPFYGEMKMHLPRLRELRTRLAADGCEAIHLTTPGPAGLAARWLADAMELPLIGSYHTELGLYAATLSGSRMLGRLMSEYMRWVYGACERVLAPSTATVEHLIADGWRKEQLVVWSRGVDCERFSPQRRCEDLRREWGVSDSRLAILYAGRVSLEKGLPMLRRVQQVLASHGIAHRFVIAGDGPLIGELRSIMADAVFTGALPHAAMGRIMASADVFLFPSTTDTAGNVVLEAQASGLPVLVTESGGPRENIVPLLTGFVCRTSDPADFCWRLAELSVDRPLRAHMSAAARAYALGRRWTTALAPLYDSYRRLRRPGAVTALRDDVPAVSRAHT